MATSGGVVLALFPVSVICYRGYLSGSGCFTPASTYRSLRLPRRSLYRVQCFCLSQKREPSSGRCSIFTVLIAALAVWRHRANIERLMNGTESRFGKK